MGRRIDGTAGDDTIVQGLETQIQVFSVAGNDHITLNRTDALGGFNTVDAGADDDTVINLFEGGNQIQLGTGNDVYSGQGFALGGPDFDTVRGGAGNDTMVVTTLQSVYFGDADNDTFISRGHRNFFDGGAGIDTISYELRDESGPSPATAVIIELESPEDQSSFVFTGNNIIEELASIENATGTNSDDEIYGSSVDNVLKGRGGSDLLVGRAGNDLLDGGTGIDNIIGGTGNDTYVVDEELDIVDEFNENGSGIDTVVSSIDFSLVQGVRLGGQVENLTLTGTQATIATGNSLANSLIGNAADNTLDGKAGVDRMAGRGGRDTYIIDNIGDIVDEARAGSGGVDTVKSFVSFSLTNSATVLGLVENLTLLDTGLTQPTSARLNATGNDLVNVIIGNSIANTIDGKAGADRMFGLRGNDTYMVDDAGDIVVEEVGGGNDTVFTRVSYVLSSTAEVEVISTNVVNATMDINLTGNNFAQSLVGNNGRNTLDGKGGADRMSGLGGNDIYLIDDASDFIVEAADGGTDTLFTRVSYAISSIAQVEILSTNVTSATVDINLSGNSVSQSLTGNNGRNLLDGKGGADRMIGLGGNDTYIVDSLDDVVIETVGQGPFDWVAARSHYSLSPTAHIERLSSVSTASTNSLNLMGNGIAQEILGNAGTNRLNGKGGADKLEGFGGNDTFVYTSISDSGVGAPAHDTILDFEDFGDNDTIDLTGFAGTMAFIDNDAFSGANQVRAIQSGADVLIQINTGINLAADAEILLLNTALAAVTASDFLL